MSRFRIRHETIYSYPRPVAFGPWRLMMRPSDSHGERLIDARFELSPMGATRWTFDAYGNSVCHFSPDGTASELRVVNHALIERYPAPLSPLTMDDPRSIAPIVYASTERLVLAPFVMPASEENGPAYHEWLRAHASLIGEPALDYLMRINRLIHESFSYGAREEPGTQAPDETIRRGAGTCRDFAWLMVESLRRFGYAARFVTGYLYSPGTGGLLGAGATHAWCEVFLPDLGWVEFDPTNGLVESRDLIRVAATRTPEEASPMSGSVLGEAVEASLHVNVSVELADEIVAAAP